MIIVLFAVCAAALSWNSSECRHIYLDFGSSVGVQVRKLFEPEKYVDAPLTKKFDELFGDVDYRRRHVCAVGFEANPAHTPKLRALEACYRSRGYRTKFYTETIVGVVDGWADFFSDGASNYQEWGSSIFDHTNSSRRFNVSTVDIARFIRNLDSKSLVVIKMDIEASEFVVLPHLLANGLLCMSQVHTIFVGWHTFQVPKNRLSTAEKIKAHTVDFINAQACQPTHLIELDDGTFLHDGQEMPCDTAEMTSQHTRLSNLLLAMSQWLTENQRNPAAAVVKSFGHRLKSIVDQMPAERSTGLAVTPDIALCQLAVIGVFTKVGDTQQRNVIRDTWFRDQSVANASIASSCQFKDRLMPVFVLMSPNRTLTRAVELESDQKKDIVVLDGIDNVNGGKRFDWYEHAAKNFARAAFICKCDSDTVIDSEELAPLLRHLAGLKRIAVGPHINFKGCGEYKHCDSNVFFISGMFSCLSRDLVQWIAHPSNYAVRAERIGIEDVLVGKWFEDARQAKRLGAVTYVTDARQFVERSYIIGHNSETKTSSGFRQHWTKYETNVFKDQ